jgi:hypothetical protein
MTTPAPSSDRFAVLDRLLARALADLRSARRGRRNCSPPVLAAPSSQQRGRATMTTVEQQTGSAIRPFHVEFSEEALDDLRRRIAATRWPSRELVDDRSQGVQLATIQEVDRTTRCVLVALGFRVATEAQ